MTTARACFRPCIDLHDGKVKQIVGSTLHDNELPETNFIADRPPRYFAGLYRELGLPGGHVIQLGSGNEAAAREALAAWPGNLQLGGGVNAGNAAEWLRAGASHVIVTSFIFSGGILHWDRLNMLLKAVGREHLVLDLSCRKRDGRYYMVTDRWQKFTEWQVCRETLERLAGSAAEFLIHAVDAEGKRQGIDVELLQILAEYSPIDCVYAGGIADMHDIEMIEKCGRGRIHYTVGSALDIFGGTLPIREIVSHCRNAGAEL